jgi:hypothetical protein
MKALLCLLALVTAAAFGQAGKSAFATVTFGNGVQVDLPRNWTYMDKRVADHMNTSSEADANLAGLSVSQGDNEILVAANAYDSQGKSKATLRISVRVAPSMSQAQMRELAAQPSSATEDQLRSVANETVKAMLKVPGVRSYAIRAVKLDRNTALVCSLSSFEGDLGRGLVVSDTWVCPLGDRTLKLSTSYEKGSQSIYLPTLGRVWRSLQATAK